mmetsp:Transcript_13291/g.29261  ORF Transcript_13291/g.29261 Transcript_13291/m.29261 type:complete len:348 (-) Transcript_13291:219-1262(-)
METVSRTSNCIVQREDIKLLWRSTFIDVEAPLDAAPRIRSSSVPATPGHQSFSTEFKEEQIYVNRLVERASHLSSLAASTQYKFMESKLENKLGSTESQLKNTQGRVSTRRKGAISRDFFLSDHSTVPSLGDVSEVAEVIAAEKESFARRDWDKGSSIEACAVLAPDGSARTDTDSTSDFAVSRGSFGHPHLCERVCAYAAAGLCKSGSDCSYCHITHHTKQVHLDKQNRRRLQAMSYEARAAFMLPILEQKARENDFGPACEILMTLLAKDAKLALGRDQVPCKLLGLGGLSRVMTAMSFHTVLRHLLGGLPVEAAPSTADVHLLLEAMRLHVSDTGIESGSVIPF